MPYSRRPLHPKSDTKCPDGFACYGWRQVHKGGYVNWYGHRYYCDDLAQWAGMWVYIEISDWLASELDVYPNGMPESSRDERVTAKMKDSKKQCTDAEHHGTLEP